MKNIITFFLIGSLVSSLSCGENRTVGNSETQDKQVTGRKTIKEQETKKTDTDKDPLGEISPQSVNMGFTVEDKDWQSDYNKLPLKTKIKGIYLKLFTVSYEAFLKDAHIIPEHKKIENYTIRIYEEKKYFHVCFDPKYDPEFKMLGGETPYGREVRYVIEKQTFKIKTHHFFK